MEFFSEIFVGTLPVVFQGHPLNFKVTQEKNRDFLHKLGVSGL